MIKSFLMRFQSWVESNTVLPFGLAQLRSLLRMLWWAGSEAAKGTLTLHAMSLAYTTLVSMVPLLAVSFSVLKAFGVHNQIEPLLLRLLEPLGEKSLEITAQIVGFVENIKVGVLGAVGVAVLFYTVVTLMQKIERSFNSIWRISGVRPLSQRFAYYLSVILIGPVLIFAATALSATILHTDIVVNLKDIGLLGQLLSWLTRLAPFLMIIAAFTFIYLFIPNTRVKLSSALFGAVIAGALWETVGMLFANLVSTSTNYTAVYSTFASLVLFMVWVSTAWMILLLGSVLSYAHQHRAVLRLSVEEQKPDIVEQEKLGLAIMQQVCQRFAVGDTPPTTMQLATLLAVPQEWLVEPLDKLQRAELLRASEQHAWLPARTPERILATDVLAVLRKNETGEQHGRVALSADLEAVWYQASHQRRDVLANYHFGAPAVIGEVSEVETATA